jgi:hypothetical protein
MIEGLSLLRGESERLSLCCIAANPTDRDCLDGTKNSHLSPTQAWLCSSSFIGIAVPAGLIFCPLRAVSRRDPRGSVLRVIWNRNGTEIRECSRGVHADCAQTFSIFHILREWRRRSERGGAGSNPATPTNTTPKVLITGTFLQTLTI